MGQMCCVATLALSITAILCRIRPFTMLSYPSLKGGEHGAAEIELHEAGNTGVQDNVHP